MRTLAIVSFLVACLGCAPNVPSRSPSNQDASEVSETQYGQIPKLPAPGKSGMGKFLPFNNKTSSSLTRYLEKIESRNLKPSDTADIKNKIAENPEEYFRAMNILMATLPKENLAARAMIIGIAGWMPIGSGEKFKFLEKHTVHAQGPLAMESFKIVMNGYPKLDAKRVLLKALVKPGISRDQYFALLNAYNNRYPGDFDNQNVEQQNTVLQVSTVLPQVMNGAKKQ